jgi:hypothetical protein
MIKPGTAPVAIRPALLAVAAGACLAFTCVGTTALAASAVHYEREELSKLQEQLHRREVRAVGFHPGTPTGHIHASLNGGRHVTVAYATAEQAQLVAQARAGGAPVTIATVKAKAAKKPVHHKLRYIAGGIVIVVIIVVAAVLLVDRRRKLGEAGGGAHTTPSSSEGP